MITARMDNDKYIELSPKWPYEVVKYESGKIKLKGIPRIYPASDFQLLRDGEPITEEELEKKEPKQKPISDVIFDIFSLIITILSILICFQLTTPGPTSYEDIEHMGVREQIRSEQRILGK